MCLEINGLDFAHFFWIRISMASNLTKTKIKLDILTVIDVLLMVEKCITGGICHAIIRRYMKANNKYIKDYDKNEEP